MILELTIGYNRPVAEISINASYTSESTGTVVSVNGELPDVNGNVEITIPENTSDLNNDSNFVADASYVHTDNNYSDAERLPYPVSTNGVIDLSHPYSIGELQLTSNLDFTALKSTAIEGRCYRLKLDLNGHSPTFSDFTLWDENTALDTTAGKINIIYFVKSADVYYYIIFGSYVGSISGVSSISEALTLTDSQSATASLIAAMTESFNLTDTQNAFIQSDAGLISETITLTDSQSVTVNFLASISEALSLTDNEDGTIIAAVTFVSAATSTDGLTIGIIYSKTMPASPTYSGMSFSGTTSGTHVATGATRDGSDTSKVNYTIAAACVNGETVTANYTAGNIVANDGGILANFSSQAVTNNVVSAGDYYRLNTYGTEFFVYDAKDAANFTLSGSDITAIKDGSGNSRDMSYLSGSNFVYNSANDNYTSNGGNQNGIYTPSSNIDLGSVHSIIWVGTFTSGVTQTVIGREPSTGGCQIKMGSSTTWVAYYPTSENVGPQKIWNPTTAYGAKHVFIITRNGATTNLYVDGTLISALGGTIDTTSSVIKGIGALALNDMLKGLINYQAAINVELTASQVTTISTALNARY